MIGLFVWLCVILMLASVALYAIRTWVTDPMLAKFGTFVIVVFACIACILLLLDLTGAGPGFSGMGRLHC